MDKNEAEEEAAAILDERLSHRTFINFNYHQTSHQVPHLKSLQYQNFQVLCHLNIKFQAGWIVCPYIRTVYCSCRNGLLEINITMVVQTDSGAI